MFTYVGVLILPEYVAVILILSLQDWAKFGKTRYIILGRKLHKLCR